MGAGLCALCGRLERKVGHRDDRWHRGGRELQRELSREVQPGPKMEACSRRALGLCWGTRDHLVGVEVSGASLNLTAGLSDSHVDMAVSPALTQT